MSKLDELTATVAANTAADDAGFTAIADAVAELASDVAALNTEIQDLKDNPDVQAQIDELITSAQATTDRSTALAQAIRDAVPTAAAEPTDA